MGGDGDFNRVCLAVSVTASAGVCVCGVIAGSSSTVNAREWDGIASGCDCGGDWPPPLLAGDRVRTILAASRQ